MTSIVPLAKTELSWIKAQLAANPLGFIQPDLFPLPLYELLELSHRTLHRLHLRRLLALLGRERSDLDSQHVNCVDHLVQLLDLKVVAFEGRAFLSLLLLSVFLVNLEVRLRETRDHPLRKLGVGGDLRFGLRALRKEVEVRVELVPAPLPREVIHHIYAEDLLEVPGDLPTVVVEKFD